MKPNPKPKKHKSGGSSSSGKSGKPVTRGNLADLILASVAALGAPKAYVVVQELPRGQVEQRRTSLVQRLFAGPHEQLRGGKTVIVGYDLDGPAPRGPLSRASSGNDEYVVEVTAAPPAGAPDHPFEGVHALEALDLTPLLR